MNPETFPIYPSWQQLLRRHLEEKHNIYHNLPGGATAFVEKYEGDSFPAFGFFRLIDGERFALEASLFERKFQDRPIVVLETYFIVTSPGSGYRYPTEGDTQESTFPMAQAVADVYDQPILCTLRVDSGQNTRRMSYASLGFVPRCGYPEIWEKVVEPTRT